MGIVHKDSKIKDIILEDPSVIQLINRFGIYLGVGHSSVKDECSALNVDVDFFLVLVNTYLYPDYFPGQKLRNMNLPMLADYLAKTDAYYLQVLIPNIEKHLKLLSLSGHNSDHSNLDLFVRFFEEIKEEISHYVAMDTDFLFPMLKDHPGNLLNSNDQDLNLGNSTLEDKVIDLVSMFVVHLKGDYNPNLTVGVVTALWTLAKDIRQNNRIRERILRPLCRE